MFLCLNLADFLVSVYFCILAHKLHKNACDLVDDVFLSVTLKLKFCQCDSTSVSGSVKCRLLLS